MTTKDTADRTGEAIDFTMMYVTHDAFRRVCTVWRADGADAGVAGTRGRPR